FYWFVALTRTCFKRPRAPDLISTADMRHLKCLAISAISSALALPSTGGDFNRATQLPSGICSSDACLALGLTLTCSSAAWSAISATHGRCNEQPDNAQGTQAPHHAAGTGPVA